MIFVDTSVWVAAWRRPKGKDAEVLLSLLDADEVNLPLPVRVELMSGTARKNRRALRHALGGLAVSRPTDETWNIVERWIPAAADAGYCFAVSDYLIAALAYEHQGVVWSLDRDFEHMEKLGFVRRY